MKKIFKILVSILSNFFLSLAFIFKIKEKNFVILICSYNNEKYINQNLLSAVNQNYKNFEIIYINDLSTDKTEELFHDFIRKHSYLNINIKLINNKFRKGSLRNKYDIINNIDKNKIIINLDGDDFLYHNNVLKFLNLIYTFSNCKLTYGNYISESGRLSFQKKIFFKNFNRLSPHPSHLRSFYAYCFQSIPIDHFKDHEGNFFMFCEDRALMYPLFEIYGNYSFYVPFFLYIYNDRNPNNINKKILSSARLRAKEIIQQKRPLSPISHS